ncbi:hypothetical protein [Actinomadura verrucosospora]|uniref:Uncharacterized protein n=1 Tax=Actinomadura verrucosospora TaxID=46165 RepID=A0A7D3ZM24_ACTVE|nr:hypothetical protein [Actinomadura verrucosospora]QKG21943.1 hypothetical protein ACTIVE_3581 [Actinomadura verrucosospora]
MIFLLLRRLGVRARMIAGAVLVAAGLAVIAASVLVDGLLVHGVILAAVGAVMCGGAARDARRARAAAGEEAR